MRWGFLQLFLSCVCLACPVRASQSTEDSLEKILKTSAGFQAGTTKEPDAKAMTQKAVKEYLGTHEQILSQYTKKIEQGIWESSKSAETEILVLLGAFQNQKRIIDQAVKDVAKAQVEAIFEPKSKVGRETLRAGESIEVNQGSQKVIIGDHGQSMQNAWQILRLGSYQLTDLSAPKYQFESETVVIAANCKLMSVQTIKFQLDITLQGYDFSSQMQQKEQDYFSGLDRVNQELIDQNQERYTAHTKVVDEQEIGKDFQEDLLKLQVLVYRLINSSNRQYIDDASLLWLERVLQGFRPNLLHEAGGALREKHPQIVFEVLVGRFEHLARHHRDVLQTHELIKRELDERTIERQTMLSKAGLESDAYMKLSLQFTLDRKSKREKIDAHVQEGQTNTVVYQRSIHDQLWEPAGELDAFWAVHKFKPDWGEALRWRSLQVLKLFYSSLVKTGDYDDLYPNACARALLARYKHLQVEHECVYQQQGQIQKRIEGQRQQKMEFLGLSADSLDAKGLDAKSVAKIQKVLERAERSKRNARTYKVEVDTLVRQCLQRIQDLLKIESNVETFDSDLKSRLEDILDQKGVEEEWQSTFNKTRSFGNQSFKGNDFS